MLTYKDFELFMMALCIWREARGENHEAKVAVGCSIRNRVDHPTWWGVGYIGVITHPFQYSSFNPSDPNSRKWPVNDRVWQECLDVAQSVISGDQPDTTEHSVSYFDKSLDKNPPTWAKDAIHTVDIDSFHFFKFS